jgi:hypothetical protein
MASARWPGDRAACESARPATVDCRQSPAHLGDAMNALTLRGIPRSDYREQQCVTKRIVPPAGLVWLVSRTDARSGKLPRGDLSERPDPKPSCGASARPGAPRQSRRVPGAASLVQSDAPDNRKRCDLPRTREARLSFVGSLESFGALGEGALSRGSRKRSLRHRSGRCRCGFGSRLGLARSSAFRFSWGSCWHGSWERLAGKSRSCTKQRIGRACRSHARRKPRRNSTPRRSRRSPRTPVGAH